MARDKGVIMDFNPGDNARTRRTFRMGSMTIETNVEGFDPTALRGMTEADIRAIVEGTRD